MFALTSEAHRAEAFLLLPHCDLFDSWLSDKVCTDRLHTQCLSHVLQVCMAGQMYPCLRHVERSGSVAGTAAHVTEALLG